MSGDKMLWLHEDELALLVQSAETHIPYAADRTFAEGLIAGDVWRCRELLRILDIPFTAEYDDEMP